jgi:hypothetical protein
MEDNIKVYTGIFDELKDIKVDKVTLREVEESFSQRLLITRKDYTEYGDKLTAAIEEFRTKERIIDSLRFYTYTYISEALHDIMDPMFKRKLATYETTKVKEFLKEVKDHSFLIEIKKIGDRAQNVLDTIRPK